MREALSGLTVRGRAFLAAGITAIVCAILLGQPSLSRVGVLVLALPLVSAFFIGRSRYRLALVRTVSPQLVAAGQPAAVSLSLSNEGRTPSGVLLLEDHLPYVLGTRPRFVLEGIGHGWHRDVTYQIRSDVRGRFEIGPVTVRVKDPFGLVELGRAFRTTVPLTVTPRTVPLSHIPLGGAWTGSGDNRPRAFAMGSAEDVTVREYRRGDDLRRVHWRSSARVGELMVRREEQPWESRATLFLDNRVGAHRGQGIASSLEAAVSAAASIALHLSKRGFTVRLVTASGEDRNNQWHTREADLNTGPLLEALAVVQPLPRPNLDTHWLTDAGGGGLLVAVLGYVDQHDVPVLRRMQAHSGSALAVAVDVDAWLSPDAAGRDASSMLVQQGWRSVALGPADQLADGLAGARPPAHAELALARRTVRADVGPGRRRRTHGRGGLMATARSHPATLAGLSAVAAGTTLVSLLTWQGFTESYGDTLGPLVLIAVVVAGTGAAARWWRVPRPLLVLAQVVLVAMIVSGYLSGSPLPIGDAWDRFQLAFTDAVDSANRFAPPVPAEAPPVHPLLIAGGAACLLLTDLLACTLRRVPLAGLPLLTIYSVPVSMTGDGPHWILFTITAVGFLAMIFLSESEQIARWGPILAEDLGGPEPKPLSTAAWPRTGARAIGGVATALAIVVPVLIPTFSIHLFDFGPGTGGDDDISIQNPMVDLRRDLVRGDDVPLVRHQDRRPRPVVPPDRGAQPLLRERVELGRPRGAEHPDRRRPDARAGRRLQPAAAQQLRLRARRRPATSSRPGCRPPATSTEVDAPGDWRFDTSTMDFLASDDDLDTAGLDLERRRRQDQVRRDPAGHRRSRRRPGLARLHRRCRPA